MKLAGEGIVPNRVDGVETRAVRTAAAAPVKKAIADTGTGSAGARSSADVHLTGASRGLAALERSLRDLPAVDEARVAAVRQRIENGSYEIDPQRIADRLMGLEHDLGRSDPLVHGS